MPILREVLHFFVSLLEVSAVVVSILLAGLIIAKAAFWILSRALGLFADRPVAPDRHEDEMDDDIAVPTPLEDPSLETDHSSAVCKTHTP